MINLKFWESWQNNRVKRRLPVLKEKHQWQLVSKSYAMPIRSFDGINLEKLPQDMAEKMILGVTTYMWECLITGDVRKQEILGSDTQTIEELLIKAKQYGKQIIKDESGNIFTISLQEKEIDLTTLPMRRV